MDWTLSQGCKCSLALVRLEQIHIQIVGQRTADNYSGQLFCMGTSLAGKWNYLECPTKTAFICYTGEVFLYGTFQNFDFFIIYKNVLIIAPLIEKWEYV